MNLNDWIYGLESSDLAAIDIASFCVSIGW